MQIVENRLIAKVIDKINNPYELNAAYSLRYKVFVDKLQWLPAENYPDLKEIDEYDDHCVDFGVFTWAYQLVGYARLILDEGKFMLEKEFGELVSGQKLRRKLGVAEVSRLTILPGYKLNGRIMTSLLLYKLLYHWALLHSINFFYLVIDDKLYYNLKRLGLVCNRLEPTFQYQPGVSALVAYVDLAVRRIQLREKNPELFAYFTNEKKTALIKHEHMI